MGFSSPDGREDTKVDCWLTIGSYVGLSNATKELVQIICFLAYSAFLHSTNQVLYSRAWIRSGYAVLISYLNVVMKLDVLDF